MTFSILPKLPNSTIAKWYFRQKSHNHTEGQRNIKASFWVCPLQTRTRKDY